jgi:tetratricopeptide (TPR) repeat protein
MTSVMTTAFTELDSEAFDRRVRKQLADRKRVQFWRQPVVAVVAAKAAVADGSDTFDDQMTLMVHFAWIQNWSRVLEHLQRAEQLADEKPGLRWLRNAVLNQSRRRDELKQRVLDQATGDTPNAFLADYLLNRAAGILEANEMLGLLDTLKPVYDQLPDHMDGQKRWITQRVNYLQQTGQTDQVLQLRRELAEQYPHDANLQSQYTRVLSQAGEYQAAYAWLKRVVVPESRWLPHEESSLRTTYCDLLQGEGRYPDMVEYLSDWVAEEPDNQTAYARYLSALVHSDREDDANRLIARWIKEARRPGAMKTAAALRLDAAVSQALGQGYNLYTNRIERRWFKPLAATAESFAMHKSHPHVADRIMNQWTFRDSDACRGVRRQVANIVMDQLETIPENRLATLVGWITPNDPEIEVHNWRRMARGIEQRWAAEEDTAKKDEFAGALVSILSSQLTVEEHLEFLRRQLADGPAEHRARYATQLFDALLDEPYSSGSWWVEREDEAFRLLPQLSDAQRSAERLRVQVAALHRLTDTMVRGRYDARMAQVEHPEHQTRTELRATQQESLRLAREKASNRLRTEERRRDGELRRWLEAERLYLDVLLKRDLDKVAAACWKVLDQKPEADSADDVDLLQAQLDTILRDRHLTTLANLAVRRSAQPGDIDRLLDFVDAAITAAEPPEDEGVDPAFGWRLYNYQLLVALDRPQQLEQALQDWTGQSDADHFWRRTLAYLAAEQGRVQEAIMLFEQIEADDELIASDYRALAGWYLVTGDRYAQERALIESFKAMEEWRMSDWLYQKLRPWQRSDGSMPEELDKDVLRVFVALFQKSSNPQNYEWQLRQFYRATRDFRLLAGLADAAIGHTAGRVYPFLQRMSSTLGEIRDEATADSIVQHLAEVRKRAKTDVDSRALDLLELLVERRSSEVLNQPGPHVDKALAAMQRAFRRQWSPGEPRLMADLLASLGRITQQPLADEQVRQLEVLHDQSESGSVDRLHIAHALARAYWSYARHDEAIDLLEASLAEYQRACDGVLPAAANGPLDTFISYLESRRHYARGEQTLFAQLKHPVNRQQVHWLRQRLYRLYNNTLDGGGDVSLGSGDRLYHAVTAQLWEEMNTDDHNHRYQLLGLLCTCYRTAKNKNFDGVTSDLRGFAFERLPQVLGMQTNNYQSMVNRVANTLEDLIGPRDGLELLIECIENEPSWFRLNRNDGWSQHSYRMADWRRRVGDELGDLEPRLLTIVITELKRELRSRDSRNRNMYHKHYGNYYWAEHADDFARAAEEVYQEEKHSGAAVQYIADYLFWGVERHARSIEMLLEAYRAELLDRSGQWKLVDFLHRRKRYAESIPILLPLVERYPDEIQFPVWLMHAYYQGGRTSDLLALLKVTDEYFHEEGRWQEHAMAALAKSTLDNHLFEQSVAYYEEVINLHQRTQPGRGIGKATLSMYYSNLSQAYAGWQKTAEAVDAACGAVISWGPRHDQRAQALNALEQVLRNAPDLDGYVVHLDGQVAETGLDNPIVRKALGKVYSDKTEYKKAIRQLEAACELQPNDTEIHQQLVACYDKLDDQHGAIRRLLQSVRLSRRSIQLFKDLGQRYEKNGKEDEAERAFTSIVEALPNESESHAMLAELRQQQDRWPEAIEHWQQVAKIRELEPTGLLKLAEAQIHQRDWDGIDQTIKRLRSRTWPERFGNMDSRIRDLERRFDQAREH